MRRLLTIALCLAPLAASGQPAPSQPTPIPLATWPAAPLTAERAQDHLLTAGAIVEDHLGDPRRAATVLALGDADQAALLAGAEGPPLRQALLARAAAWMPPGPVLDGLLTAVAPSAEATPAPWPEAYRALPPLRALIREAIEAHGEAALPLLARHPRWARDRGLEAGAPTQPPALAALPPCEADLIAADQHLRQHHRLAAGLRLSGHVDRCPTTPATWVLLGDYWRHGAVAALARGDLIGAEALMRRAWWSSPTDPHRLMLADALTERSRLAYAAGEMAEGRALFDEAEALAPEHPPVQRLAAEIPRTSLRARFGVLITGAIVLWFALRRLRRLWGPRRTIRYSRRRYTETARRRQDRWRRRLG